MKTKSLFLIFIGVMGMCCLCSSARATVVTASITGTASGTLGDTSFTNTPFVWTLTYDTASYSPDYAVFLNPASAISLQGASSPAYVTQYHGLFVFAGYDNLLVAPVFMSGPGAPGSDMVEISGQLKWDGFSIPYQSDSASCTYVTSDPISTNQGQLLFSDVSVTSVSATAPYEAWAAGINWNGKDSSPGADPDGDGVVNLMEYALGGDPLSALSAPRPKLQVSASNNLEISFLRAGPGLTYTVQGSSDLINWSEIPYTPVAAGQTQTVSDTENLAISHRRFLRLRVSSQ